jgi:5-methylcytosine-specific restriction enzyme A
MALRDISREAVLAAIAEYDLVGQEAFLSRYGFDHARLYTLVHDGKLYDSKAIVGAAHGFLPGERPLAAGQFSGGEATVGRLLRGLGFAVQVGDELTADRLERLLARLQVYRSGGLPALYQPITLLWAFERARRGESRLVSWPQTQQQVNALFQRYGRGTEGERVHYPIAALHGAGLWELDADAERVPSAHGSSIPQRWFDDHQPHGGLVQPVYDLVRESPTALAAAVDVLVTKYFADVDPAPLLAALGLSESTGVSPLEMTVEARIAEYKRLCAGADVFWRDRDSRRATKTSSVPIRSDDARRAVLLRSEGRCENPACTGDVHDVTDTGTPILEIDHIHDLALGGDDDPAQMIALCPNCHATKTRGSTREQLRTVLFTTAKLRHERLAGPGLEGDVGRD